MNRKQEIEYLQNRIKRLEEMVGLSGYMWQFYDANHNLKDTGVYVPDENPLLEGRRVSLKAIAETVVKHMGVKHRRGTEDCMVCDEESAKKDGG